MTDTQAPSPIRTDETERATPGTATHIKMSARDVNVFYGATHAIKDVSIDVDMENVTALSARRAAASRPFCGRSTA